MIALAQPTTEALTDSGLIEAHTPAAPTADKRLDRLYRLHGASLFAYLLRHTFGDHRRAEDIMQETFVRAWRFLQRNAPDLDALRPWLYTVARHLLIDSLRARNARPAELAMTDLTVLPQPDDGIERMLVDENVRDGLKALTPKQRAVLIEVYYHGRSHAEAAATLGIPVGTVKSRTHHALRALRAYVTQ